MQTTPAMIGDKAHEARRDEDALTTSRDLLRHLFARIAEPPNVELADGTPLFRAHASPRATIVARSFGALRSLVLGAGSDAAARAVIEGDLDVRGDVEFAIAQVENVDAHLRLKDRVALASLALRLPKASRTRRHVEGRAAFHGRGRKHSLRRDKAAVRYHYNVSNDFFAMWLDRELVYSCAYFRDDANSLDRAQLDKLDLICRKLRLRAGERLLDVGCGWGSLVRFAAREYGARTVGITLSEKQAEYARRRVAEERLERSCTIELRDYRELGPLGRFDKVASVGMVEHVGASMLQTYFRSVFEALEPGGLFLNHGITSQRARTAGIRRAFERLFPKKSKFIERYVFPDGDLEHIDTVIEGAEAAGFEVRDVENLREHYARTLRHWVRRLEAREHDARALVGDETYNVWRFYMAGSAHGFSIGRMGIHQTLLVKPWQNGNTTLPLTRADLYRE